MTEANKRILALDVGDVRIGVALSDETRLIAQSLTILKRASANPAQRVVDLARQHQAGTIVVGMPFNMDGSLGPQARKAQRFADKLRQIAPEIGVVHWDERLSTMEARSILRETGAKRKRRQKPVDALSAAIILQNYLDHLRSTAAETP